MGSRINPDGARYRQSQPILKISGDNLRRERSLRLRRLSRILKKRKEDRNEEENKLLSESSCLVSIVENRLKKAVILRERNVEKQDPDNLLREKCNHLALALRQCKNLLVYTGAGISTSANIPDYRGPNGVWTRLNRDGKMTSVPLQDLIYAEPTPTHMALVELYRRGILKHVVSQNCDGLHVRSGLPSEILSEIHGNMFAEICSKCKTLYWRDFDVTEKTSFHRHRTTRKCHTCPVEEGHLVDTIVHFGEKAHSTYPYNWESAGKAADNAEIILCLGSSLKILRSYPCLWPRRHSKKPKLYIVNLQWTPKDSQATLKINGKCDDVMKTVLEFLSLTIPEYKRTQDPLLGLHVPLKQDELDSCKREHLSDFESQQMNSSPSIEASFKPGWFGKGLRTKRRA